MFKGLFCSLGHKSLATSNFKIFPFKMMFVFQLLYIDQREEFLPGLGKNSGFQLPILQVKEKEQVQIQSSADNESSNKSLHALLLCAMTTAEMESLHIEILVLKCILTLLGSSALVLTTDTKLLS